MMMCPHTLQRALHPTISDSNSLQSAAMKKKYRPETDCLNCGAEITGKFCPECDQENVDSHENFFHLVGHYTADFFHFESKIPRSVIPLLTEPGFLTKEYWQGRRIRYIHPLRLFLFVSVLFVASAAFYHQHFRKSERQVVIIAGKQTAEKEIYAERVKKVAQELQGLVLAGSDRLFKDLKYISFFMLPIYAFVFQALYRRQKRFYIDHLVYTLHLQSFAYAVIAVAMLIPFLSRHLIPIVQLATVLLLLVYIAQSLRYLYRQSWPKTIVKSVIATSLLLFLMLVTMAIYESIPLIPVLPRVIQELDSGRPK
jgi:hypothetical protein